MNRTLYSLGWGYVGLCGLVLWLGWRPVSRLAPATHGAGAAYRGPAGQWFAEIKPYCNAVEAELAQQQRPAPATLEGAGYSAACFALAGKIDHARRIIDRLPGDERWRAAGIVFDVGHPVADAGDDKSAGPIMELVVGYWPNHYMALYHAGMSEYILGQRDLARDHLRAFLELYSNDDGWRRNAIEVLSRLGTAPQQ